MMSVCCRVASKGANTQTNKTYKQGVKESVLSEGQVLHVIGIVPVGIRPRYIRQEILLLVK